MAPSSEQPSNGARADNQRQSGASAGAQSDGGGAGGAADGGDTAGGDNQVTEWFVASTFRIGLAILGLVLLLFALGQAVGVPLLEMLTEALSTRVGRWLAVAVFALLLIVVALRGFGPWSSST